MPWFWLGLGQQLVIVFCYGYNKSSQSFDRMNYRGHLEKVIACASLRISGSLTFCAFRKWFWNSNLEVSMKS